MKPQCQFASLNITLFPAEYIQSVNRATPHEEILNTKGGKWGWGLLLACIGVLQYVYQDTDYTIDV